jgi:hypothetical protein
VVLLLLLSPCKVRNFIQDELEVTQTKVLNKGQAAVSQSNCLTFDVSENLQPISKPTIQQPYFAVLEAYSFGVTIKPIKHSFTQKPSRGQLPPDVPLYILYQNLQVYS